MESILHSIVLIINSIEVWQVAIAIAFMLLTAWRIYTWINPMPNLVDDFVEDGLEDFISYAQKKQEKLKAEELANETLKKDIKETTEVIENKEVKDETK